ncbi:MAG: hypothetical protein OEZ06_30455 [Myxococcales bacterium]|nr:hypothetical protein [Myxococcales bacterium]
MCAGPWHFTDDLGHLYEGTGSDFAEGFIERFEFKNDGQTALADGGATAGAAISGSFEARLQPWR